MNYSTGNEYKFEDEDLGKIMGSVGVSNDILVFGDDKGQIYMFKTETKEKIFGEQIEPEKERVFYTPTIINGLRSEVAFFGTSDGRIARISLGDIQNTSEREVNKLSSQISKSTFSHAPIVIGQNIYIGDDDRMFYKVNAFNLKATDNKRLEYPNKSQAIYCNKYIYFTTHHNTEKKGNLRIINPDTLDDFTYVDDQTKGKINIYGSTGTPLIVGNYMYIPSTDGKIYRYEGSKASLNVKTEKIDFGEVNPSENLKTSSFMIENDGGGVEVLKGTISVSKDWINCEPKSFSLKPGQPQEVKVSLQNLDKIPVGIQHFEQIIIESGTEKHTINVLFTIIKEKGRIHISTNSMDLGSIRKGDAVDKSFTVSLEDVSKSANIICEIEDNKEWITLSRSYFELSSSSSELSSKIMVDTKNLDVGKHTARLEFFYAKDHETKEVGPPTETMDVSIEVIKMPAKPFTDKTSETIVIQDCFTDKNYTVDFKIENDTKDGERDPLEFDNTVNIDPEYDWLTVNATLNTPKDEVDIVCTVNSELANFWPNENFSSTLTVTVSGIEFAFEVSIVSNQIEQCSVSFIIDSEKYTVNSRILDVTPAPFISENGNTMVPIRFIAEPLEKFFGAEIEWIPDLKTVLFTLGDTTLRLRIGNTNAYIERGDGSVDSVEMNSAAEIVDGRTFIPPRTIAEAFGAEVKWNGELRKADFIFTSP
ncbi:MAG: stalk domain-containing protein [Caldisericia bacterium]